MYESIIFRFFSITSYYKIASIVPILYSRPLLVIYFIYSTVERDLALASYTVCVLTLLQSCPTLCNLMDCSLLGSLCPWDSLSKNAGVGSLLWGIFLTQGLNSRASLVAQMVKCLPTIWETWVRSLGQEDPLKKEMATHSSIHAWKIPWTEEPGGLQSMGLQRVRHD